MNQIPTHKSSEMFKGNIAWIKHISNNMHNHDINYAHRDDYYMFMFMESGEAKVLIDFEEYTMNENGIYYILPAQVHLLLEHSHDASAWMLAVDSSLVSEQYKEVFNNSSSFENEISICDDVIKEIKELTSILDRRLKQNIAQDVIRNILSTYISIVAEVYQEGIPIQANKRAGVITSHFKSLLSENHVTMKRPSEYAEALNISPAYLNEVIKDITGYTVGECIRSEVVLRAKRLLYHTNMNVKDIAISLGYEDWAYFSRLFSKETQISPTEFRVKYRK